MSVISPGLKKFVLFNPATGDKVTIDGNAIAPSSTVERSQLTRGVNARGGVNIINDRWQTTINFADADAYAALDALTRGKLYQYVAIGFDRNVLHYENQSFSLAEKSEFNPESEEYPFSLTMTHIGPSPDIKAVVNIIAPWKAGDGGLADGFASAGSGAFAAGVQTIGHNADFDLLRNIILPVEGLEFTLAVDWLVLHDDGANSSVLVWRDFAGDIIRTDSIAVAVPGVSFDSFTAPTDAWSLDIIPVRVTGVTVNDVDAQIQSPVLRNVGSTYINA